MRKSFLILGKGADEIAYIKQRYPQQKQGLHPDARIIKALGELVRLSGNVHGQAHFATNDMPGEVTPHHSEELSGLSYSFAQFARMNEDRTDFRGCVATRRDIRSAERVQELQLKGIALRVAGKCLKQSPGILKVCDRLGQGAPPHRLRPRKV